jgi:hypothetical protein
MTLALPNSSPKTRCHAASPGSLLLEAPDPWLPLAFPDERLQRRDTVAEYVLALKAAGWPRLRIVTDHGWLLMPGGFEPIRLPPSAVIAKGSRAAILHDEAAAELAFLPWHWDRSVRIAMPSGAEAFRAGEVYSHGGLSPQECVIPDITVHGSESIPSRGVRISTISWRRLRLTVELTGELADITLEVRRRERDAASRVDVASTIEGARVRLTISDEVEEGDPVLVVLVDRQGSIIDARATGVGDRVCPLVAQTRSAGMFATPPLLGDKRTWRGEPISVAIDPTETLAP